MPIGNAGFISACGMRDAMLRLDVAAGNVANGNTPEYEPSRVDSTALAGGGVTAGVRVLADASVLGRGGNAGGDESAPSRTDFATEGVGILLARSAFMANAAAFRAASQADRSLMEAFG